MPMAGSVLSQGGGGKGMGRKKRTSQRVGSVAARTLSKAPSRKLTSKPKAALRKPLIPGKRKKAYIPRKRKNAYIPRKNAEQGEQPMDIEVLTQRAPKLALSSAYHVVPAQDEFSKAINERLSLARSEYLNPIWHPWR